MRQLTTNFKTILKNVSKRRSKNKIARTVKQAHRKRPRGFDDVLVLAF